MVIGSNSISPIERRNAMKGPHMSNYVVRCIFNGTGYSIPVRARSAGIAMHKAQISKLGRKASAFIVYLDKIPVLAGVGIL